MKKAAVMGILAATLLSTAAWGAGASGTVTFDLDLSAQEKGAPVRLWLPYPTSDAAQSVSDVAVSGDYAKSAVYADTTNSTPILYAEWPAGATSRKLTFSFAANRQEVVRKDFPKQEGAWNPQDYRQYLAATALAPTDGEVKKLADSITKGKKTVLEKARAIYDWTCENTWRDPKTRGCGKGDVCQLLAKPGGKCADIHSVFVALCRAAGVPAREVFGIRLGKKETDDLTGAHHCWAEFFLPGYGWVPADPADVRKAILVDNLKMDDPKVKQLRDYYFGAIDAYRVKLSVGRDLTLNPPQQGERLNYFMYPYAEVAGKPVDWLDPQTFIYKVTFKKK